MLPVCVCVLNIFALLNQRRTSKCRWVCVPSTRRPRQKTKLFLCTEPKHHTFMPRYIPLEYQDARVTAPPSPLKTPNKTKQNKDRKKKGKQRKKKTEKGGKGKSQKFLTLCWRDLDYPNDPHDPDKNPRMLTTK